MNLTKYILLALVAGIISGVISTFIPEAYFMPVNKWVLVPAGIIFIKLIKMLPTGTNTHLFTGINNASGINVTITPEIMPATNARSMYLVRFIPGYFIILSFIDEACQISGSKPVVDIHH